MDASALAAFSSENFPPLASVGVDYAIAWEKVILYCCTMSSLPGVVSRNTRRLFYYYI